MPLDDPEPARRIDRLCREFEDDWRNQRRPLIEEFLAKSEDHEREPLLVELIALERELLAEQGAAAKREDYLARFPLLAPAVDRGFEPSVRVAPGAESDVSEAVTLPPARSVDLEDTEAVTWAPRKLPDPEETAFIDPRHTAQATIGSDQTTDFREPGQAASLPLGNVRYFGDYELLREIARGGMGVVYRARQVTLNRPVALKMILAGQLAGEDDIKRFHIEAEAAANLDHPGIVPIYEIGEHDDQHFFSMGFVEGSSLAARVAEGPLPPREAAILTREIAGAIHYAHEKGVIHRDLKPGNVLMDSLGRPKVTDFGLAKKLEGDSGLTHTGQIMGTPSYMPPEQAEGRNVGPLADVYALGAILYCLLTGRPPFQASSPMDTLLQVISQDPVPVRQLVPSVPRDLETITLKTLEKDPHRRYASAEALADDLGRWLKGEPIVARPVGRIEKVTKLCRRNPIVSSLAAGLVVALVMGITVATFFALRASRNADQALTNLGLANAETERTRKEKLLADRRLYDAEMNLAQQAWAEGELSLLADHLDHQRPQSPDSPDLRGFEWYYLDRIRSGELRSLGDNSGPVLAVAYSPDGRLLASGGRDKIIRLRDTKTGQLIRTLTGHTGQISILVFSPDGTRIASLGNDGMVFIDGEPRTPDRDNPVRLWDVATGHEISTFRITSESVDGLAFSPDGKRLAFGSSDHSVQLWDIAEGKLAGKLTGHTQLVSTVAISPDGRWLASGDAGRTVKLWDLASQREVRTLKGHTDWVETVAFSPDSRLLASGGQDKSVRVWEVESGREIATFRGNRSSVQSVVFSPDGRNVASAGVDRFVRLWSVESGKEIRNFRGHTEQVWGVSFSPDGRAIASASFDGTVKIWDAGTEANVLRIKNPPGGGALSAMSMPLDVAFSPDGRTLAVTSLEGNIVLRDPETGIDRLTIYAGFKPDCVAFHPDGKLLASTCADRSIRLWEVATGREVGAFFGHRESASSFAFSPDGRTLVSGSEDGTVRLWDVETRRLLHLMEIPGQQIYAVAFAPDGKTIASGGSDHQVHLWDVAGGRALSTLSGLKEMVFGVAFHPTEPKVAASDGRSIRVWETATGREVANWKGHVGASLVFSLDGKRLFSGGEPTRRVAISNDGRRIALSGATSAVGLWDVVTGQEVAALQGDRDGSSLDADMNIVRIWNASPWTPEGRVDQEALGLFTLMATEGRPVAEIDRKIREVATINEAVRLRALALTATYGRSLEAREVEGIVEPLFANQHLREDVQKQLREQTGLSDELRTRALALSERYRVDPNTLINYAWLMISNSSPEAAPHYPKALKMAEEACRIVPDDGLSLIILGGAQYRTGKDREAIETLKRASGFPDWFVRVSNSPTIGFLDNQFRAVTKDNRNLPSLAFQVLAHARAGDLQETLQAWEHFKTLKAAVRSSRGSPFEQLISEVDRELANLGEADPRRIALDARLSAIFQGDQTIKDNRERLELAQSAYDNARHVAAARLWSDAVAADPKEAENRQTQTRYNAACAAALAGCGQGKDHPAPDDPSKAKLRGQALEWLQIELAIWTKLVESGPAAGRPFIIRTLNHWKVDADLAGVREAKALEALPEAERKPWRDLWTDVDLLLTRVQTVPAPAGEK